MLKALINKQFRELFSSYYINKKTGKVRTKGKLTGLFVLFGFLVLFICGMFFGISFMLGDALLKPAGEFNWLFYSLLGVLTILMGTFGSVFNTYAALYKAKDNELLLSMPIPPRTILASRMASVLAMSVMYSGIVWLPGVLASWIILPPNVYGVIVPLFMFLMIALLVTVLTCILGWVVALVSTKLKNKGVIIVLLGVGFFVLYEYVCMQLGELVEALIRNAHQIGESIRAWAWPIWKLGQASAGDGMALAVFTAMTVVLSVLCGWIMSATFIRIATTQAHGKRKVYHKQAMKNRGAAAALLNRELKHFLSSPIYMMNTALGLVIMLVLAGVALIKQDAIHALLLVGRMAVPGLLDMLTVGAAAAVCMIVAMNGISAPSVSLEGNNIWIAQTMPVHAWLVLRAKERLHVYLNILPSLILAVVLGIVLQLNVSAILAMMAVVLMFVWFTADLGLMVNVKKPNLNWTSETVPVKQSMSVTVVILGGWLINLLMCGLYYLLRNAISGTIFLVLWTALLIGAYVMMNRWLRHKGAEIFAYL